MAFDISLYPRWVVLEAYEGITVYARSDVALAL
jgi:hypothetical protein